VTTQTSQLSVMEDALLALLQTDATLSVIAGPPQLTEPQNPLKEACWLAEDADATQIPDTTGNSTWGTAQEISSIAVHVLVAQTGDDYKACRDRADVLTAAVESVVKANPKLGGAAWDSRIAKIERSSGIGTDNRFIVKTVTVEAVAYLS
jgi:hypothetical protein